MSVCSSGSSIKDKITFEELSFLIKPPEGITDSETIEFTLQHQKRTLEMNLRRLNKILCDIKSNWSEGSSVQIYIGYELCNNDLETLLLEMGKPNFKERVDSEVKARTIGTPVSKPVCDEEQSDDGQDYDNDEYVDIYTPEPEYERRRSSHRTSTTSISEDEFRKRTRRPKDSEAPLDPSLPVPENVSYQDWARWSEAKRKSYLVGMENPNSYFYRNVAPGEVYRLGPFTLDEKKIFLKRVEEFRDKATGSINGSWGLFSRALPGRVGYQCSNFYRKLVENGEIRDPKYIKGEDGQIHHTSHLRSFQMRQNNPAAVVPKKEVKVKHFRHKTVDPDKIVSLFIFSSKLNISTQQVKVEPRLSAKVDFPPPVFQPDKYNEPKHEDSRILSLYDRWSLSNPIPGWTDPLTGDIMRVPAISPDLSLLDYSTWLHAIKSSPEDPFTKRPITKRQIVVLNFDNWDIYRDRIIEKYGDMYSPKESFSQDDDSGSDPRSS